MPSLERKPCRPQISPALYATPEAFTPLPDSPSSFPPSPYIVNHKRRGLRLLKSSFEADVVACARGGVDDDDDVLDGDVDTNRADGMVTVDSPKGSSSHAEQLYANGISGKEEIVNGFHNSPTGDFGQVVEDVGSSSKVNGVFSEEDEAKLVVFDLERDIEVVDFFDPQESMSYTSNTDAEDNIGAESSSKLAGSIQTGEFYDAREELSSESGQQLSSLRDIEAELHEIRLNLLMEIEKNKQAEEALSNMQSQWQRIREQLALAGLTLPASLGVAEGEPPPSEHGGELCQQVYITRFVANCLGRGSAKAEMKMEMEAQIEAKNFEINRLWDRLHYYEAMNHEMSQRNQEAVEMARRDRTVRKRRQRWVWGSIGAAMTLGTAALAWSYLVPTNGSSSSNVALALENDDATEQ